MVESFAADKLSLPALVMKKAAGYETVSYGDLRQQVRNLGTALLARGVSRGDRVGLISENRSEWVITYLAVTSAGAVIVPYDILLKVDELGAIARASGARIIFTSSEYREKVGKAVGTTVPTIVLFDPPDSRPAAGPDVSRLPISGRKDGRCGRRATIGTPPFGSSRTTWRP